ncbi:ATP-binding protein [Catenulispora subtropica]|uniref:Histidine kinase/HSP90-like ATPase domain-containing protein n=1 Tax=Catenulispora subtropica TaxID=450798 RepID=A0ABN2T518_9ACTN
MQQLRHPAPACRASGREAGGGVAVRGTGEPAGSRTPQSSALSWSFPGSALDVSLSRRWLAAAVEALWGAGEDADRLVLAYSEVATNAVVHGRGPVTVSVRIRPGAAVCEVGDCSTCTPEPRHASPEDVSGRGLDLVAQTVDRLRVTAGEGGKKIVFEVGRRPGAAAGSGGSPVPESAEGPVAEEEGAMSRAARRHHPARAGA